MGNCFAYGRGLVHPTLRPFQYEEMASGTSSRIKVRMTMREFNELVSRAESRNCDSDAVVGTLIMEGVRQGRWEAVPVGGVEGGHGRRKPGALQTIHED